mmetsp:Transcript_99832/g.175923  ORF Transcript_99832/g.175923 Transcript_99832/m.175923 type:complete len:92 (+) Transcript_99832:159-434(+)
MCGSFNVRLVCFLALSGTILHLQRRVDNQAFLPFYDRHWYDSWHHEVPYCTRREASTSRYFYSMAGLLARCLTSFRDGATQKKKGTRLISF